VRLCGPGGSVTSVSGVWPSTSRPCITLHRGVVLSVSAPALASGFGSGGGGVGSGGGGFTTTTTGWVTMVGLGGGVRDNASTAATPPTASTAAIRSAHLV